MKDYYLKKSIVKKNDTTSITYEIVNEFDEPDLGVEVDAVKFTPTKKWIQNWEKCNKAERGYMLLGVMEKIRL